MFDSFAKPSELEVFTEGKVSAIDTSGVLALNAVSALIRNFCGWHVYPEIDEVMTVDTEGGNFVSLPTLRLTQVRALTVSGSPVTDYSFSGDGSIRLKISKFPDDYRAVTADVRHGFEDIDELKMLCLTVASRTLASPMGVTQETAGSMSLSYGSGSGGNFLSSELSVLQKYRVITV